MNTPCFARVTPRHYPYWFEVNGEWGIVSSFCWEQEEAIEKFLNQLRIPYQIARPYQIEDRGFNLWVQKWHHEFVRNLFMNDSFKS